MYVGACDEMAYIGDEMSKIWILGLYYLKEYRWFFLKIAVEWFENESYIYRQLQIK